MPEPENEVTDESVGDGAADADGAVDLALILDGKAFLEAAEALPKSELHEIVIAAPQGPAKVYVREIGQGEANEILVGQWRKGKDGRTELDELATFDRFFLMTIQKCIVDDKGKPLWTVENVRFMYDSDGQAKYAQMLRDCYAGAVQYNPHLEPTNNPLAYRRLVNFF